jgi:hypothetical protein
VNKFVEIGARGTLSGSLVRGSTQCTEASALRFNFETATKRKWKADTVVG